MEILMLLAVMVVGFLIISSGKKAQTKKTSSPPTITKQDNNDLPYKKKFILTKNEYAFYKVLKPITDEKNMLICPKVGLKDLFDVTDKTNSMKYFGRIAQKHIDFLICDDMLRPLFAIELDDTTHQIKDRVESDDFKNKLFTKCEIKLKRIKAFNSYNEEYLKKNIFQKNENTNVTGS